MIQVYYVIIIESYLRYHRIRSIRYLFYMIKLNKMSSIKKIIISKEYSKTISMYAMEQYMICRRMSNKGIIISTIQISMGGLLLKIEGKKSHLKVI